jgi:hypothetical protein
MSGIAPERMGRPDRSGPFQFEVRPFTLAADRGACRAGSRHFAISPLTSWRRARDLQARVAGRVVDGRAVEDRGA